ncbi:MAG: CxxH/CxxC protein [Gorillibacterium sp.]|nr:CxxH/CxxC protein [Gorillibacterium sp.]
MYCVCKEHVEIAIDRFVDEYEEAPDVVDLQKTHFAAWDPPPSCEERDCNQDAQFLVI